MNSEQDLKVEQKCKIRHKQRVTIETLGFIYRWLRQGIGRWQSEERWWVSLVWNVKRSLGASLAMTRRLMFAAMMTRMMFDNESFVAFRYSDPRCERSKERAVPWMRPCGPWTLGGGLLIFFPHISSPPDTYYFLCLGAMSWIHLTPPTCMNKYTPSKYAVAPFIVQGLTESIFEHLCFEWTVDKQLYWAA